MVAARLVVLAAAVGVALGQAESSIVDQLGPVVPTVGAAPIPTSTSSISSTTTAVDPAATTAASTTVSDSQYWHERYHGILSMAAYGDYDTLCPVDTFNQAALLQSFPDSTEAPWQVLQTWGPTAITKSEGFIVSIPEMDKVVVVFKGVYGWEQYNMTAAPISDLLNLGPSCNTTCTAHQGALTAYLEAKEATNDWQVAKDYAAATGHQFSITGHAFGGMVAQIASLVLGWNGFMRWTHNHGSPRVFGPSAAQMFTSLYQGEAGQRVVANEDSVVELIPESEDYTFALQGFHIFGTNATYGMSYTVCEDPSDPECAGGDVDADNLFYYTPIGLCGKPNVANATQEKRVDHSMSKDFYKTATSTWTDTFTTSTTSTTTTSETASVTASSAANEAAVTTARSNNAATSSPAGNSTSGAGNLVIQSIFGLFVTASAFALLV